MTDKQIKRLIMFCGYVETSIESLKDELKMAITLEAETQLKSEDQILSQMLADQDQLLKTKYDRTNYHLHKAK